MIIISFLLNRFISNIHLKLKIEIVLCIKIIQLIDSFEGTIISIKRAIYEIETDQGLAKLFHLTPHYSGSNNPILFLHGFGSNASVWYNFKDSLGHFFQSNKLDCWSLGLSNAVSGDIQLLAHQDLLTAVHFIYQRRNRPLVIIAHSMGGIIVRVFSSPHLNHPYPLQKIEKMIKGIVLLTVPNHGVALTDIKQIEETVRLIQNFIASKETLAPDLGLGFIQLVSKSQLLEKINSKPPLNPHIHTWINAVGSFDRIVPLKSALFTKKEIDQIPAGNLIQKEFPCDHMTFPLANKIQKMTQSIPLLENALKDTVFHIYPAIHRFPEVGELILKELILK